MSGIENADAAKAALDSLREEQATAEQTRRQHASTKARLEAKRAAQTRTVDVLDEPVEFTPVGVGVARRAMRLRRRAMNGDDEAEEALIDLVFETLAEAAVDDALDEAFWEGFSMETVQSTFEELVMSEMEVENVDEIEEFRSV